MAEEDTDGGVVRGFEGMILSDLVDMVPGLAERLFPAHRIMCLIQVRFNSLIWARVARIGDRCSVPKNTNNE